ncbi:MAG: hypothetical protein QF819_03625 [Gemmatimonadota bacterium]|jgi:serine/threonine protein kinase|nr:hypothetical protein [Gemmatimonadota bacterium]MDP6529008.1 hypothetical protein [Gemmatimonadota bacterium]MDP6802251.1 hypothetical protein [Gemmatimonadota bacterium]MDP7032295.1 hypothetical protein [Gemmatimonadota bacterium]
MTRPDLSFGPFRILERHDLPGDAFDAAAKERESGREVRLWAGIPGSAEPRQGRPHPDEVRAGLSRVYHSSLPKVLRTETIEERAVLVLQPCRGRTLSEVLAEAPPVDPLRALSIVESLGAALAKAHRAGFCHGHLDEDAVLLDEGGKTMLLRVGWWPFLGSRPPLAPEDLGGGEPRPSADVFALARLLARLLLPEDPCGTGEAALRACSEGPDPAVMPTHLPEGLRRFLARALLPVPNQRIARADELTGDLRVIRASWASLATDSASRGGWKASLPRWLSPGKGR